MFATISTRRALRAAQRRRDRAILAIAETLGLACVAIALVPVAILLGLLLGASF